MARQQPTEFILTPSVPSNSNKTSGRTLPLSLEIHFRFSIGPPSKWGKRISFSKWPKGTLLARSLRSLLSVSTPSPHPCARQKNKIKENFKKTNPLMVHYTMSRIPTGILGFFQKNSVVSCVQWKHSYNHCLMDFARRRIFSSTDLIWVTSISN